MEDIRGEDIEDNGGKIPADIRRFTETKSHTVRDDYPPGGDLSLDNRKRGAGFWGETAYLSGLPPAVEAEDAPRCLFYGNICLG